MKHLNYLEVDPVIQFIKQTYIKYTQKSDYKIKKYTASI